MITNFYEKIKSFMIENWKFLLFNLFLILALTYPLPYYIYAGGGTMDVSSKVEIKDATTSEGAFHLAYVTELKATIPTYLLSFVFPSWMAEEKENITMNEKETLDDVRTRDRLMLDDANQSAIEVAYRTAGKDFHITSRSNYVVYLSDKANTTLQIGDDILTLEGTKVTTFDEIKKIVMTKQEGDIVHFLVKRGNKEVECSATIYLEKNVPMVGFSLFEKMEYETNPPISLSFSKQESGPSGGLILALSIYDKLVEEDITRGLNIVGTGTIDRNGNIGAIGGAPYKLQGAVKSKADIFLVPMGENYEEAIRLKKEKGYKIEVIGVKTFEDALMALKNIEISK